MAPRPAIALRTRGLGPMAGLWVVLVVAPLAGLADRAWWLVLAPVAGLIAAWAWRSSRTQLAHAGLLAVLSMVAAGSALFGSWPLPLVVALTVYLAVTHVVPPLRRTRTWLRWEPRSADRATRALFGATVVASVVALVLYAWIARPHVADALTTLQSAPRWVIPLAGIGFVLVNPAVEEALYRGTLYWALEAETGRPGVAVVAQGVAFGVLHVAGFPGGPIGMILAGVWGGVLGVLRARTGGLKWSWLAHVAANIVIFVAAIVLAVDQGAL